MKAFGSDVGQLVFVRVNVDRLDLLGEAAVDPKQKHAVVHIQQARSRNEANETVLVVPDADGLYRVLSYGRETTSRLVGKRLFVIVRIFSFAFRLSAPHTGQILGNPSLPLPAAHALRDPRFSFGEVILCLRFLAVAIVGRAEHKAE